MVVSDDGKTVYFGRFESYEHDRMNLGVLSLDSNGQPVGDVKWFQDCTEPLQPSSQVGEISGRSSIIKIVLDTTRTTKKLYLSVAANGIRSLASSNERSHLSIYDLDQNGIPIVDSLVSFLSPIVGESDNVRTLMSFTINNNKMYFVGILPLKIWVWNLDPNTGQPVDPNTGQPVDPNTGQPVTSYSIDGVGYFYDIAVNSNVNPNLLYLGAMINSTGNNQPALLVVKLTPNGDPDPTSTSYYIFGSIDSSDRNNNGLQFHYTPGMQAIYRRRTSVRDASGASPAEQWPITAWPLDPATGIPVDTITTPYVSDNKYLGFAESIDPITNRIWIATVNTFIDKFTNQPCVSGVTVAQYNIDTQTGLPTGDPIQTPTPPLSINM